ncbi:MAG: hypothetical protein WCI74_06925 [Actinomycetes bacterium]
MPAPQQPDTDPRPPQISALDGDAIERATDVATAAFATAVDLAALKDARLAHMGDRSPMWARRASFSAAKSTAVANAAVATSVARSIASPSRALICGGRGSVSGCCGAGMYVLSMRPEL